VARIDAHLLNRQGVARLCYCGSVLHTIPAGMTKMREPIQIGAELYGHAGLEADVEIVRLMIDALKAAGLARIHIDLGHPGIYRAMIEGVDAEAAAAIFHAVQQKDASAAGKLAVLTELNGGVEVIDKARRVLPAGVAQPLDDLQRLAAACATDGVEISVDLAELGGFEYESGLLFAAFAPGSPDAIARGGRYDEVGRSFGRARPATGFTMDLRQLARMAVVESPRTAILCPHGGDAELRTIVQELRRGGEVVIEALPGHDTAELKCDRRLEKKDGKWRVTSS
jgi:ATP phosphoribosyltransferase regulatory subunit